MQDADLLVQLAGIAGVFVGFGALISVRSGGASDAHGVAGIRWVVAIAIWVVVAALAPVIVSRYGVTDHVLWLACGLLALALWLGVFIVNRRTREMWEDAATYTRGQLAGIVFSMALLSVPMEAALVLVLLGLFPDLEPALYLTAVAFGLFIGALTLLMLVFSQPGPQPASDPVAPPATGGSSA